MPPLARRMRGSGSRSLRSALARSARPLAPPPASVRFSPNIGRLEQSLASGWPERLSSKANGSIAPA
eukprot:8862833-Alexandrium_andersonii.AAC.1